MKTIFLIVWLVTSGGHTKLADDQQTDAPTCFAQAAKTWDKYADRLKDVHGAFELQVSCQMDHDEDDPA